MIRPLHFLVDRQRWHDSVRNADLRLIKTLFREALPGGTIVRLLDAAGASLDVEHVHPDTAFPWCCGFWLPAAALRAPLRVGIERPGAPAETVAVELGDAPLPALPYDLPRRMHDYLDRRERAADLWPGVRRDIDVPAYLRRYDILYERPAAHWTDGLYLGSGIVGGVITGAAAGRFHFGLDHAGVWWTTPEGRPLGRGYAADLHIDYAGAKSFRQRLSIGDGTVHTRHGGLEIRTWVDRETHVAVIELRSRAARDVRVALSRSELPLIVEGLPSILNGSWVRVATPQQVEQLKETLRSAPHAEILAQGDSLLCRGPNMSVLSTLRADVPLCVEAGDRRLSAKLRLPAGRAVRLLVAVAAGADEAALRAETARALERTLPRSHEDHARAWRAFWQRSFVRLGDPLQENIYYQGLYQMACSFAGDRAPGFFGLTQPVDHRTWLDCHVTDAQTELLTWGALTSNHLALTAPLLKSYAECWREQAEHTPVPGAKCTHWFQPMEGGGHAALAPGLRGSYPFGSPAWHVLDYWHDYLYSGDRAFLRRVAYPILRACAEAIRSTMTLRDGVYHCLESASAEQYDTPTDNIYDRACVEACLRAVIAAAGTLRVDAAERRLNEEALRRLFPLPSDGRTIFETMENRHPYRCHPVVIMGLYPLNLWREGMPEWDLAQRTFDVVNNLYGFHYEDRHKAIIGHEGGIEPNGHATAFLLAFAARLKRPEAFDRLFRALVIGRQLKPNALRSIADPRHSRELERMGIIEASSGQTAAIAERLVQSWPDRIEVFPCIEARRPARFAGLRAMGGFVLSAEWTGRKVAFIAVHSLAGGRLDLRAPWQAGRPVLIKRGGRVVEYRAPVRLRRGETVFLSQDRAALREQAWRETSRPAAKPVAIPVPLTDPHTPEVLYYPEDLPHGQEAMDGHLYIGLPARPPRPASPVWGMAEALRHAADADARLRQTAARVLGRHPCARAVRALERLALDPAVIVAATALVALAAHNRKASDAALDRVLPKVASPYVRNEAAKALNRRRCMAQMDSMVASIHSLAEARRT
jgi:hypothetical protein